jgi:hypothetical protein
MIVEYREEAPHGLHWYFTDGSFEGWARTEEEASISLAKVLKGK